MDRLFRSFFCSILFDFFTISFFFFSSIFADKFLLQKVKLWRLERRKEEEEEEQLFFFFLLQIFWFRISGKNDDFSVLSCRKNFVLKRLKKFTSKKKKPKKKRGGKRKK